MNLDTWLVYLLAAIGLSLSPGPNGLLALTHGALHGPRKTLFTILGGSVGFIAVVALSMFGIGALLQTSLLWLTVMKWVGGAYLVWLGIQVWRSPPTGVDLPADARARSGPSLFRQGLLSAVTNPKALLFFAAFLPQFIDPRDSFVVQLLIFGGTFVVVEVSYELLLAGMAQRIAPWLARHGRWFNRATGGTFIGVGALLTTASR